MLDQKFNKQPPQLNHKLLNCMELRHKVENKKKFHLLEYKEMLTNVDKTRKTQSLPQLPRDINYIKETLNCKKTKALFLTVLVLTQLADESWQSRG